MVGLRGREEARLGDLEPLRPGLRCPVVHERGQGQGRKPSRRLIGPRG